MSLVSIGNGNHLPSGGRLPVCLLFLINKKEGLWEYLWELKTEKIYEIYELLIRTLKCRSDCEYIYNLFSYRIMLIRQLFLNSTNLFSHLKNVLHNVIWVL